MAASNYIHLEGKIEKETDKAFYIDFGEQGKHWIPMSQVADSENYKEGDIGTISITEWIAGEKGLIDE